MKKIHLLFIILVSGMLFWSCKKNPDEAPSPQDQNEEELITSVSLIIKDNDVLVDTFTFRDPDGAGGITPTAETITLASGKSYTCSLLLLDQTKNPIDTISLEIEEEGDVHQFFFHPSASADLTFTYVDFDTHGVPIGLHSTIATGVPGTGTLTIVLKHQDGVKPTSGNGNEALGETDVEVEFDVTIQ